MSDKLIFFDLEIAKILPEEFDDIWDYAPLGITCIDLLREAPGEKQPYHVTLTEIDKPKMTKKQLVIAVDIMYRFSEKGYKFVTWNGLGFDFRVLAEESGEFGKCKAMALGHYDMMYQVFCMKGFPIRLNSVASTMGFGEKTGGMTGAEAPKMWTEPDQRDKVLEYVRNDTELTQKIFHGAQSAKRIEWTTRKGKISGFPMLKWLNVADATALDLPNTDWMDNPMAREDFYKWTK